MSCCGGEEEEEEGKSLIGSAEEETIDCSQWMTNLPENLTKIPINQLAIPGSHDSGAYYLDPDSPISPDESSAIKIIGKSGCGKQIIIRWSLTQKVSITEQLNQGIRYFDIRSGYLQEKDDFYFVHGCYGYPICMLLQEMTSFLKEHPKEVLIVDFNHYYSFSHQVHIKFIDNVVYKYFKGMLYPNHGEGMQFTLSDMWKQQKPIFARYCCDLITNTNKEFWPSDSISSPWYNTSSITQLVNDLNGRFDTLQTGKFNVFQAILTPQTKDLIFHFQSSLKKVLSDPGNKMIKDWLGNVSSQQKKGVNIVICDFICSDGIVPYVLKLNDVIEREVEKKQKKD